MDSAPAQEVTELLRQWEEQHTSPNYDPIPTLTRIAEIIEAETENFLKKDPDPFDERHPSRTDPECALGHALKVMFKKDNFMTKLVNDYVRDTYYSRQNITGRDVFKLNVCACRLTLDLMPGLEMSVVFQDNEALIHRLVNWATNSPEPLQCYATGLLAAAMEVQEIATNFRDLNAMLVPLMLRRLHGLRNKGQDEKVNQSAVTPPNQTRHFARFDKRRSSDVKANGPIPDKKDREKDEGGGGDMEVNDVPPVSDPETPVKNYNSTVELSPSPGLMSPPARRARPAPAPHETESNSSWAEMETYVIGNIQIHPPTDATKQMLILRYLTPMGEYQEFLSHVFEQNALGLILGYLNVRESRDSRLAFEALKYLAALLCHKKFSIDFINMGGLQKFLEVPRPSVAATGVSICLYYLAYCEDAMERVCLLPRRTLADLVRYALWLLECSHDSGRCHATMFFGLSFQFRVILEEFDNQDGLRKLYNVISTLPILGSDDEELPVSEDETCAARQIVRHVCVALKRYLEAHLRLRAAQVARQQGDNVPEPPPYKASKSSPEEIQEQIELLQSVSWSRWPPVDELLELGGISLLLQVVGLAYEWNFNGRSETVRSALDVVSVCCIAPRVQLLLTEKIDMRDADLNTGVNIVLGAADGEIVPEPEVQKAALNVLVNCVCAPVHRAGTSTTRFSITGSSKKKTALKSYEDVIQKVWESVRINNGIMVLLSLMMVKSPITDADRIRGLACRALAGLARCSTVRQIISKLPLFTTSQIQVLMRDPILQEKRQEHVMFQKYALELLERVSGKSKHMGAEFETSLANIHRANVVAQTRINYNERQLLQLVASHLAARGLTESAATLQREAGLPPPAALAPAPPPPPVYTPATPLRARLSVQRTNSVGSLHRDSDMNSHHTDENSPLPHVIKLRKVSNPTLGTVSSPLSSITAPERARSLQKQPSLPTPSEPAPRVTLHSIITEYLYNQHSLCKNPVVTCPQFNLFEPHKCPEPRDAAATSNVCARVFRRELGMHVGRRADARFTHSHFAPVRTLRLQDDDAYFTHTIFHPTQHQLLAATSSGDIRVFNLFSGAEENSYQVHESYICHMQASRDGLLLLASTPTTWRPLSALWNMKEFEQLFQLENEEYVEFSKMSDDRIIGTKGETATIFDTLTGRELMTLTPAISNQYAKNRATFNPSDELVLSDGVLWDVNTGKEIHKFDKLNQTHSGVFHPNGLEVISNTEVWDLRTFHLLRTVPTLDKSENDQENIAAAMLEKENIPPGENYDAAVNIVQTLEPNSFPETINLGCENTDNQSQNILILNQDVPLQQIQEDIQALKHDLKTILTNQNALFELQNKLLLKHSEFQTQFEEYIKLSSKLPAQDRDDGINTIKTSNDFDDFERNLLDAIFKEDHKKKLRGLCSRGSGKGTSNAYYLIDYLFDREFLKSCTWTGSSKKDPVKICFKARERTINFFHDIVKESDKTFSKADCEKFFKIILKNAHQRCESNKRASSARQRTKGKKTKNDTATTSSMCAIEQPVQEDNVRPPPEPLLDQPVPAIPESSEQNQLENVEVINLPSAAAVLPEN